MSQKGRIPLRRRSARKTDFRARRKLLLSGLPRLVVRNALKNTLVQVIEAHREGDRVIASASTKLLTQGYGWKGGGANTPAAYLTGLLAGLEAGRRNVKEAVLDTGVSRLVKGSRTTAALKGANDAGLRGREDRGGTCRQVRRVPQGHRPGTVPPTVLSIPQ